VVPEPFPGGATTARDLSAKRAKGRDLPPEGIRVHDRKTRQAARTLTPEGIRVHDRKTRQATRTAPLTAVTEGFARYAFQDLGPDAHVAAV
jgi:hypothetical protein